MGSERSVLILSHAFQQIGQTLDWVLFCGRNNVLVQVSHSLVVMEVGQPVVEGIEYATQQSPTMHPLKERLLG